MDRWCARIAPQIAISSDLEVASRMLLSLGVRMGLQRSRWEAVGSAAFRSCSTVGGIGTHSGALGS